VHGSWTAAFVQGAHRYFLPVLPDRSSNGRGCSPGRPWPASVREVTPGEAAELDFDAVVVQRPRELLLAEGWLRRRPGRDLPAVYVEHETPPGRALDRHPIAGRDDFTLVHVNHFNELFWDSGSTRSLVIEPGIVDPGYRYRGSLPHGAAVIEEAQRQSRASGIDLLERFARKAKVDLFGPDAGHPDLLATDLHEALAERRVYLHVARWRSPHASLIEAMHLGMPVVALATAGIAELVPACAGVTSTRIDVLESAFERLLADPDEARALGLAARREALRHYTLPRFLAEWDRLLGEVAGRN